MILGIISDIHQDSDESRNVLNTTLKNIREHGAVGLLMAGDIGDNHNNRVRAIDNIINSFPDKYRKNLALMLGNHDVRTGRRPDGSLDPDLIELYHSYLKRCNTPYDKGTMCVDFSIEGYHFLCLNTDVGLKDQMELNNNSISWLKEKLAKKAEPNKPIFIVTHQPFNSTHWRAGLYGGFGPQDQELKEIFLNYPQIVMLNGHIHNGFGVIEFIQRPYGTLIEIPSLVHSENGVTKKGTGYLLKVSNDKLVFEAWDFKENKKLPEHCHTVYLPTLSVLTQSISDKNNERKKLLVEANNLMNRRYNNDIPNMDSTTLPQEYYNIDKNYTKETWDKINRLRNKIIDSEDEYHDLKFKNNEDITEDMLTKNLSLHDHINISMYDGCWAKNIIMPKPNKTNQRVKIKSKAGYKSTIKTPSGDIDISSGDELIFSSELCWMKFINK